MPANPLTDIRDINPSKFEILIFNTGITSNNPVQLGDPSLGGWPLQTWLGAGQAYYGTPAKIAKMGGKHEFEVPNIVW
jgi:hypothetical protein